MAPRPIFCATHPRAVSTAFERVFMTCRDTLRCVHEPFGDAFYFGPERMGKRFANDEKARQESGYANTTYRDVLNDIESDGQNEGKRIFIKDMAYYFMAPDGEPTSIAPSLGGRPEPTNPTNIPLDILRKFNFTFLIRHPSRSVPSYWRCTIPPLSEIHGFDHYMPSEAGYEELVRLFDYLISEGIVDKDNLTVLDADDMLDNPEEKIKEYCKRTEIEFDPKMLEWTEEDGQDAAKHFAKWNGFHDDAIHSSSLRPRAHAQKASTVESENAEWTEKFGADAAKAIRRTVDANIPHYEYLKQFKL
ncbi:uncharacterized protein J7T54_000807 [Emericellopsis cladophorae]|uniref:Branched-chain-amino-acid aminotransferase-like protein 2 n=1 Tax=Emericellopsis cladophorae TaxID=2686198 RepID=A0A9P9XVJ8_9HYPO|nr:uncharacterized protein J7T54_000807 [Emericellopsis cladophorae]KAI6778418.1 hypothetical protein J7T54_000807 [Emericellopsis cladophorae]